MKHTAGRMGVQRPWFCLILLAPAMGACQEPPRSRSASSPLTPASLLQRTLEARASLSSLKARATMRILDRPRKFSLRVNTEILAQTPDRLRLKASKALGQIEAFDTVMIGNKILFHVPRRHMLYRGRVDELEKADIHFDPGMILQHLLRPDRGLLLRRWRLGAQTAKDMHVLDEIVPPGQPRLRLCIEAGTYDLQRVEHLDAAGAVSSVWSYARYRHPERKRDRGGRRVRLYEKRFPFQVTLEWPLAERSVTITFKSLEPDVSINPELWLLDVPERTRVRPLHKLEVEGDKDDAADTKDTSRSTP